MNLFVTGLFLNWMKYILSISLTLLILLTGLNVKIASHYCGGQISAAKVSLTGEVATCGMEHQTGSKSTIDLFSRHCCEDVIHSFKISSIYVPSVCFQLLEPGQILIHSFILNDIQLSGMEMFGSLVSGSKRPPGVYTPVCVEQQVICIFQI
ncbi:MAG: hypothetical protein IPN67_08410 [Bacteroidales bacterium]|nr:hypothetical protein [Bacteroidales bacterium]